MDLTQIADALADHCRNGTEAEGLKTLYASDAVSVEAFPNPNTGSAVTEGIDGIYGQHQWWASEMEVHSARVDGPHLHGSDRFALIFEMDASERASGKRWQMKEVGIYTIADGKIVREEFFYTM